MNSFNYLRQLKQIYESSTSLLQIIFILGNNTCDMDSFLSAYLLSIGKNIKENIVNIDKKNIHSINKNINKVYLPVLNIKRGTLGHRLDVKFICEKYGLDENDFWYISDEIFSKERLFQYEKNSNIKTSIILVDHNLLSEEQDYLANYIVEIYDHHELNNFKYPNLKSIHIKYPLGSCTTLILLDYFSKEFPSQIVSPLMSITAILMDTKNFEDERYLNRWVDLDKIVYKTIKSKIIDESFKKKKYYKRIKEIKNDEKNNLELGLKNLLKLDQKKFNWDGKKLIWSSLPVSYNKIKEKFGQKEILLNFYSYYNNKNENDIKNTFIMIHSSISNKRKIFCLFNPFNFPFSLEKFKSMLESKLKTDFIEIKEENILENELKGNIYYIVTTKICSRKILEPLFKNILTNQNINKDLTCNDFNNK